MPVLRYSTRGYGERAKLSGQYGIRAGRSGCHICQNLVDFSLQKSIFALQHGTGNGAVLESYRSIFHAAENGKWHGRGSDTIRSAKHKVLYCIRTHSSVPLPVAHTVLCRHAVKDRYGFGPYLAKDQMQLPTTIVRSVLRTPKNVYYL